MSLISLEFLVFLGITAIIYFLAPKKVQWIVLLIANYVFYAFAGAKYIPFLLYTTFTTYIGCLWLSKLNRKYKETLAELKGSLDREQKKRLKTASIRQKRWVVALVCVLNFGVLGLVKYSDFLVDNINGILSALSLPVLEMTVDWILPLGISFYTFQAIGYLVDVYRDQVEAESNFFKTALFLSFFPQLVQGPISRYEQLAHQLTEEHRFDYDRFKKGAYLILWGLFKKLVIAERIVRISNWVFNVENQATGVLIFIGAVAYSIRVYTDFSGGIDIARGAAQILGIELTQNFERPYFATTIGEFWRRWHMSLGSWFRDYVFYPLSLSKGLSKAGKWGRKYLGNYIGKLIPVLTSQFVVFTLIGVWHGSSWKYIAFGFYHGIMIVGGILLGPKLHKIGEDRGINMTSFGFRVFQILRTFIIVVFGRIFTMGNSLTQSMGYYAKSFQFDLDFLTDGMLSKWGFHRAEFLLLVAALFLLFIVSVLQERGMQIRDTLLKKHMLIQWIVYLALIFTVIIFGVYGYGYASSDFIYRGF